MRNNENSECGIIRIRVECTYFPIDENTNKDKISNPAVSELSRLVVGRSPMLVSRTFILRRSGLAIAFLFPGQGAQYTGMGRELYESSPAARAVFDTAEKIRPGTITQCFSGSDDELAKTENTQPCLFCVDLAAAEALKEMGITADMLAGFSLGELASLSFSGAVAFEDGFRLVCKRAEMMQEAADAADAAMSAVLKLSDETVVSLCAEFEHVYPVNFNCPGQVVVSGAKDELDPFKARVIEEGGRAMPLKTGGGFHSPFMASASIGFSEALSTCKISRPEVPVYSNLTAGMYDGDFLDILSKQISSPVLWDAEVRSMLSAGASVFVEVGPGKVLCSLVQRIANKAKVYNVEDAESLTNTIEGIRNLEFGIRNNS